MDETLTIRRTATGELEITGSVTSDAAALLLVKLAETVIINRAARAMKKASPIIQAQAVPSSHLRPV